MSPRNSPEKNIKKYILILNKTISFKNIKTYKKQTISIGELESDYLFFEMKA